MGRLKVVYERAGRREDVTGWQKWAIAIPAIAVAVLAIVVALLVVVIVLGVARTAGVIVLIAVPVLIALALLARLVMYRHAIQGSGNLTTEARTLPPFSSIKLNSSADVVIDRTGTQSVTVSGDDNILALFTTEVKDGTLHLAFAPDTSLRRGKSPLYRITVTDLRSIEIDGSGDVKVDHLDGAALTAGITGSGDMQLNGRVDELALSIEGSGDIDATELQAKRAKIRMSGSGDATVNASDTLDVQLSGSGDVRYVGSPKLTKDVRGSGSVEPT
jgi:putative autotransporter adhesin-like protein